jgi:hypothetical protein
MREAIVVSANECLMGVQDGLRNRTKSEWVWVFGIAFAERAIQRANTVCSAKNDKDLRKLGKREEFFAH